MADTPDIATALKDLAAFKARMQELQQEYEKELAAIFARLNERYLEKLRTELTTPPSEK
jgi:hypothetical protein